MSQNGAILTTAGSNNIIGYAAPCEQICVPQPNINNLNFAELPPGFTPEAWFYPVPGMPRGFGPARNLGVPSEGYSPRWTYARAPRRAGRESYCRREGFSPVTYCKQVCSGSSNLQECSLNCLEQSGGGW